MTAKVEIIFQRNETDETVVQGERGKLLVALDGTGYAVFRFNWFANKWDLVSNQWRRFGDALAFACGLAS